MGTHVRWGLSKPLQSALVWIGETPHRTAGKDGQASSVTRAGGGDRQDQRSPLRRCFKPRPLRRAECAGFASSCRSDFLKSFRSPGDWRASCPAAYRSTHGHRHVRNWAVIEIIHLTRESTLLSKSRRDSQKISSASVKKFFVIGFEPPRRSRDALSSR